MIKKIYSGLLILFLITVPVVLCFSANEEILLSIEPDKTDVPIEDIILQRRTIREYSSEQMTFNEASKLLYFANGITQKNSLYKNFRAAPSAGALYPIEIYLVSNGVSDLRDGLYWFNVKNNSLVIKRKGSFANEIAQFCYGQRFIAQAEAIFLMTAVWRRTTGVYGERGRRYVILDAGHIAQNIYLEATALGLAPCAIGAFNDNQINAFLEVKSSEESCVYIMVVGK